MGTNSWILETASHEPERQGNKARVCPPAATRTRSPRLRGARAQLQRLRRSPRDLNGRPPRTRALTMAALRASCGLNAAPGSSACRAAKVPRPRTPSADRTSRARAVPERKMADEELPLRSPALQIKQVVPDRHFLTSESLDNYDLTLLLGLEVMKKKKKLNSSRFHK